MIHTKFQAVFGFLKQWELLKMCKCLVVPLLVLALQRCMFYIEMCYFITETVEMAALRECPC